MSDKSSPALFSAGFNYTEDVLSDFEALYLQKKEMPLGTRVVLGILGAAGALYFGFMIYRNGVNIAHIGYLLICSVLLVLAFSRSDRRPDDTPAKYRKHYLNRHVSFSFDDAALEMRLEGQKNYARSKYREIYGLAETDRCIYCVIKGKAHYIISKDGVADGRAEDLMKFLAKKCGKRFQHYDVSVK